MNRKTWLMAALVAAGVVAGSVAGVMPGVGDSPGGQRPFLALLKGWQKLDLSETQKAQAAHVLKANRAAWQTRMAIVRTAQESVIQAASVDPVDEVALRMACRKLSAEKEELVIQGSRVAAELRALLTPAQRESLKVIQADARQAIQDHHHDLRDVVNGWIDKHADGSL